MNTPDAPSTVNYRWWRVRLPDIAGITQAFFGGASGVGFLSAWETVGTMPAFDAAQYIKQAMLSITEARLIGEIVASVSIVPPVGFLLCDGATYARADYPQLYAALPSALILSGSTFKTPDLRDRFVMGGDDGQMGETGGSNSTSISGANMPPHSHGYEQAISTPVLITIGAGAPLSASLTSNFPQVTSTEGSGSPIDTTPAHVRVQFLIAYE